MEQEDCCCWLRDPRRWSWGCRNICGLMLDTRGGDVLETADWPLPSSYFFHYSLTRHQSWTKYLLNGHAFLPTFNPSTFFSHFLLKILNSHTCASIPELTFCSWPPSLCVITFLVFCHSQSFTPTFLLLPNLLCPFSIFLLLSLLNFPPFLSHLPHSQSSSIPLLSLPVCPPGRRLPR